MATTNDITKDKIQSRYSDEYRKNYDKIFGNKQDKMKLVDFSEALNAIKNGGKVKRKVWTNTQRFLSINPKYSDIILDYISNKNFIFWSVSQKDVLATDWIILE